MRRRAIAVVAGMATLFLTACDPYTGINSLPLPGSVGTGGDSYEVTVQMANANDLVPNTPVFINDINVGTVTKVGLRGWTPTLTVSLGKDVKLPANSVAALAQTSLLGSKHVELTPAPGAAPEGTLTAGAVIPESRVKEFPETEDLLAGLSGLLNGGGLQHFQTITTELNTALGGGRDQQARQLLDQLNTFTTELDKQKGDIVTALNGFDRLSRSVNPKLGELDSALDQLPRGLKELDDNEPKLVKAVQKLGDASESIAPFADGGSKELRGIFPELEPTLKAVGDIQKGSLPRDLRLLPFLIFPLDAIPYLVRGDYANLRLPVNLTLDSLDKNLFTGTPLSGSLYQIANNARKGGAAVPTLPTLPTVPAIPTVPGITDQVPLPSLPGSTPTTPGGAGSAGGGLLSTIPGLGGN